MSHTALHSDLEASSTGSSFPSEQNQTAEGISSGHADVQSSEVRPSSGQTRVVHHRRTVVQWLGLFFLVSLQVLLLMSGWKLFQRRGGTHAADKTLFKTTKLLRQDNNKTTNLINNNTTIHTKPLKTILFLNSFWDSHDFSFGLGQQPFRDHHCAVDTCETTRDKSRLATADAVVIHGPTYTAEGVTKLNNIQKWRKDHQIFVLFSVESPMGVRNPHLNLLPPGFFNWTMTYLESSDIPIPYGYFTHKATGRRVYDFTKEQQQPSNLSSTSSFRNQLQPLAQRQRLVAWIVSNCVTTSKREDYVKRLAQYIPIDTFGNCRILGNSAACDKPWASVRMGDNCSRHVQQHNQFYLAFENSFCNDYVTEKFFERMQFAVPIVYGQANYSKLAPPHSFIHVLDFQSPKALADYVLQLQSNASQYLEYLAWKEHYNVHIRDFQSGFCRLCELLHQPAPTKMLNYSDFVANDNDCGRLTTKALANMNQPP